MEKPRSLTPQKTFYDLIYDVVDKKTPNVKIKNSRDLKIIRSEAKKPLDLEYDNFKPIKHFVVDFSKLSPRERHHNAIIDAQKQEKSPLDKSEDAKQNKKNESKILGQKNEKKDIIQEADCSKVYVSEIVKYYRKKKKNEEGYKIQRKHIIFNEFTEIDLKSPEFITTNIDSTSPEKLPLKEKEILAIRAKTLKKYTLNTNHN